MQSAMREASGCLPDLIKLGYPKAEILKLEKELRQHLPKSHPRIASSLALFLWYAMAVASLADFDGESIKRYVIKQLCPIANSADSNIDSVSDFLDKLSSLKSEALVGEWNCRVVTADAERYLAVELASRATALASAPDAHFALVLDEGQMPALQWHGLTVATLTKGRHRLSPKVLLDKPVERAGIAAADFRAFACPPLFVVGYGMDLAYRYRQLPFVGHIVRRAQSAAGDETRSNLSDNQQGDDAISS